MFLLSVLLGAPLARGNEWAEGVPYTTDWEYAIRLSKETGKPLLVYTGWQNEGQCHVSDAVRRAMSTLSAGEEPGTATYRTLLRENFVLLSDFIKSVQDENQTHGPEQEEYEKFRIEISYTPVLTFKDSEGTTLVSRVGLALKPKEGLLELQQMIDQALQQNGPVRAPVKTRALSRALEAGDAARAAGRIAPAIAKYLEVIELGGDARKFPDQTPVLAMEARKALDRLEREGLQKLDEILEAMESNPEDSAGARRQLQQLARQFGRLETIQERIDLALEGL